MDILITLPGRGDLQVDKDDYIEAKYLDLQENIHSLTRPAVATVVEALLAGQYPGGFVCAFIASDNPRKVEQ